MNWRRFLLVGFMAALIQACSAPSDTTTAGPSAQNKGDAPGKRIRLNADQATPDAPTFLMRGTLILGHETRSFVPCSSNRQYWADIEPELFKQASALSREPYQPMYAELIGHIEATSDTGFEADYEARFVVSGLNMVTTENIQRCNQPFRSTRAFGTEPFWSLEFGKGYFALKQPGSLDQKLNIQSTALDLKERNYTLDGAALSITQSICNDSMSDSLYGWRSEFTLAGDEKQGCAVMSNRDATLKWGGVYKAESTESNGFSVSLTLSPDHTASTVYTYPQGLPTKESGFWQQLSGEQVQVVMTRHQGQKLIAERIFTLSGNAITAPQEKINGNVYPIAGGGLTLFRTTP